MLLRDSLDAAVADVSADLHSLTTASRRQGLALRRCRRALSAVGSLASLTGSTLLVDAAVSSWFSSTPASSASFPSNSCTASSLTCTLVLCVMASW